MNTSIRGAALVALLLISRPSLSAEPMTKAAGPTTLSREDAKFFSQAAQAGMLEVQAATIASTRALVPATRDFAATMATEHGANNEALQALATSKGVTLPMQLNEDNREVLQRLQKGDAKAFDKKYAEVMRELHHEGIELFQETAKESKDSDIRAFAADTLPALQHHMDMAKQLTSKS